MLDHLLTVDFELPTIQCDHAFLADNLSRSDNTSRVIPWMQNVPEDTVVGFAACQNAAIQNGFPGFALQFGGYCFGSFQMFRTYDELGSAQNCINGAVLLRCIRSVQPIEYWLNRRSRWCLRERRVPVHCRYGFCACLSFLRFARD